MNTENTASNVPPTRRCTTPVSLPVLQAASMLDYRCSDLHPLMCVHGRHHLNVDATFERSEAAVFCGLLLSEFRALGLLRHDDENHDGDDDAKKRKAANSSADDGAEVAPTGTCWHASRFWCSVGRIGVNNHYT